MSVPLPESAPAPGTTPTAAPATTSSQPAAAPKSVDLFFRPLPTDFARIPVLYPNHYTWYVLVSFLDVMLTVKLLLHLGAREVNTIAQFSIDLFGTWGLIGLKTISMVVVVLICEYIGRRKLDLGRKVAAAAIAVSLIPVTAALAQVAILNARGSLEWIVHPIDEETGYPIEP